MPYYYTKYGNLEGGLTKQANPFGEVCLQTSPSPLTPDINSL